MNAQAATVTKTEAPIVAVTGNAVAKVKAYLAEDATLAGKALRMFVQEGGCSGMEYGFGFDEKRADDVVLSSEGFEIVMDPKSAEMLKGSTVDYVESLEGEGFAVTNPNAHASCGCGHSFSV